MSSDRDTTESPAVQHIVSMEAAPGEGWLTLKYHQDLTTMSTPVTPFTLNTTQSFKQDLRHALAHPYTSQTNPASSAPTSSNTQRSEESLSSPDIGWIGRALLELNEVLESKNADYKIDGEFSNFMYAADVVGGGMSPDAVMLTQIGIKLGRLQGLPDDPRNESRLDTIKDLAGYAVILYAYFLSKASHGRA